MKKMITYAIVTAIYLFCVWHGITIEVGNKFSFEIYPAKRLFNKETIGMNGKEYRAYVDKEKISAAKEEDILNPEAQHER